MLMLMKTDTCSTPVIGFAARSGTGKTTLLKKLIPLLRAQGLRLAVIKHAHQDFEIDHPGKDSYELRKADACQILISSKKHKALITEFTEHQQEPTLAELMLDLDHEKLDLVLVEGFKLAKIAKIELCRQTINEACLYKTDQNIIALAVDYSFQSKLKIPILKLNRPESIANFIINTFLVNYEHYQ